VARPDWEWTVLPHHGKFPGLRKVLKLLNNNNILTSTGERARAFFIDGKLTGDRTAHLRDAHHSQGLNSSNQAG
jgi:hypothetical protein